MLEVIEPDGMTTIQISNTGATSILHSMAEDEAEHSEPQAKVKFCDFFKFLSNTVRC